MAIKMKVANNRSEDSKKSDEDIAEILTPDYVREVNEGIAYRTAERERAFRFDPGIERQIVG